MKILLNEDWQMTWEPLYRQASDFVLVRNKQDNWFHTNLPCDVHMPLIEQGVIAEPLVADQCFASEWTEKRSWWFKKEFQITEEQLSSERIVITFEALDVEADIWLNDKHLDHHRSAFYPFSCDIKENAQVGTNQLIVRVTSGLELVPEQELAMVHATNVIVENDHVGQRSDYRRAMVRKPQYVYGWDWGPRVATCGITGNVTIDFINRFQIRDVYVTTTAITEGKTAQLSFRVELENVHPFQTMVTDLELEVLFGHNQVAILQTEQYLRSGLNYVTLQLEVPNAKLWWPNGMGEQPLYSVRLSAESKSHRVNYPSFSFGIRTLRLNMDKLHQGEDERAFAFEINGVTVFSKGANWIPADSIYARVTDEQYDTLIREAKEANFNMLRIWGGGLYERDIFYEKCDEYGILIWHDFMFACAKYPDHLAWFREETEREMDYQTRRLRNHCSLALWCGNNENHWGFDEWWNDTEAPEFYGGAHCYNEIAPRIVERNCPVIPYWNSSPYGGEHPNGSLSGDRHHWHDCTMHAEMEKRITPEEYDKVTAKFVSEYGYIGPCRKSSIEAYHNGQPLDRTSKVWQLHNNTFEKDTVLAGINKHYLDSQELEIDDYLLYAGLCQGLMLGYSLESLRSKPFCSGALFWMYNDCWGEVGWTIIDYYLKRKISYYFVKRAFEPVKLIIRQEQGVIRLIAINETDETIKETLEYGRSSFDGVEKAADTLEVSLAPYSRKIVFEWMMNQADTTESFYYAKPLSNAGMKPAILRTHPFRQLRILESQLTLSNIRQEENAIYFTVASEAYAHAVHFGLADHVRLSDEYFDLLPGEQRDVTVWISATEGLVPSEIVPRAITVK
ncbi:glycoside hydrolase family 2 protein [Cohnella abietis]|uniref:beta-mannosidase n=1 Tax=Cohnella abietis TaxID=2507935 RepID=A0A3T1DC89_9BACL|nr:sugar-binding domain-containing protein [Cohnella abietis]BBI35730.1 beta-mannosidase [Cohnella abietis]